MAADQRIRDFYRQFEKWNGKVARYYFGRDELFPECDQAGDAEPAELDLETATRLFAEIWKRTGTAGDSELESN